MCLAVSEKKSLSCISIISIWKITTPCVACMDIRGMVGRIYEEEYHTLRHTKMKALGIVVSEKKSFYVCPIVSLCGVGPFLAQGA